jgi:hypothetical protein
MDLLINKLVNIHNILLKNNNIRYFILLTTGVFMGYTLQPVPDYLNNIFNNSNIFKFIILFYAGLVAVYPINYENIVQIFLISLLIIIIFSFLR